MTREPIEVTRQDRIYCLKVSSDYHSEVCEECKFYPNCDHMTQDDMTELTIKDLEALEQEPTTKNDLGVDAVSRKQAIEEADKLCLETGYDNEKVIEMLNELPSVTPIRPKGRWIDKQHLCGYCSAECSSCHKRSNGYVHDNGFSLEYKYYDFCPNCGARMVEPQESEGT